MKRTLGNQTSSEGCACGFPRNVSPNKRFSFPFACVAFAIIGVPLGVTAHRRETSIGFAMGLIVATTYFLFVIIDFRAAGAPFPLVLAS